MDSYGNDVVQPPPPLKDVLADFLERTEVKKSKFWTILAIFLFAIGSQVITIIIYTVNKSNFSLFFKNLKNPYSISVDICVNNTAVQSSHEHEDFTTFERREQVESIQ